MVEATPEPGTVPDGLYRYMIHFLAIESSVTSVFLILSKDKANYRLKDELWADIDKASPAIGRDVRRQAGVARAEPAWVCRALGDPTRLCRRREGRRLQLTCRATGLPADIRPSITDQENVHDAIHHVRNHAALR